jgi:glycosyltransferase involved in cell wall biosynthesis
MEGPTMNLRWPSAAQAAREPDRSITVAICTFDDAEFLAEAIESVLAQTRPPEQLIVVDDGSTDHTAEVLAGYAGVVTAYARPHEGLPSARNFALRAATTRFLLFVDADDLLVPSALETLADLAARTRDRRAAVFYGARREFGLRTELHTPGRWDPNRLAHHNYINMSALLERETILRVGGFCPDEEGVGCEDWDLWLTLAGQGYRGMHTDAVTLLYRVRAGSMTTELLTNVERLRQVMDRRHPWVTTAGSHPVTRAGRWTRRLMRSGFRRGAGGTSAAQQP